MAISADSPAGRIARRRGRFYRSSDGKPYIIDPSGDLVKSGARKGMPKRLVYGSPSALASSSNTYNLQKWGGTHGRRRHRHRPRAHRRLPRPHPARRRDAKEFREAADRRRAAREERRTVDARRRSRHPPTPYPRPGQKARLDPAGRRGGARPRPWCRHRSSKRESDCIGARARDAAVGPRASTTHGSSSPAPSTGSPAAQGVALRAHHRQIVGRSPPAPCVLDVKSGRRRTRPTTPSSTPTGATGTDRQLRPVRPVRHRDRPFARQWPWPIDQRHALIAHLDVLNDRRETVVASSVATSALVAGREHGATVVQAKAWEVAARRVLRRPARRRGVVRADLRASSGSAPPDVAPRHPT